MRFWDLSSPEVAAADAEPWSGPLSGAMRPLSMRALVRIYLAGTVLCIQAGLVAGAFGVVAAGSDRTVRNLAAHPGTVIALSVLVLAIGLLIPVAMAALPIMTLRRVSSLGGVVLIFSMGVMSTVAVWALGPSFGVVAIFYLEALPFAFYTMRPRWAVAAAANVVVGCGLVMFLQDGWVKPGIQWAVVATTVVGVAWILGLIAERAERLAESEHAARLEVADLNRTLEARVAAQVAEIERLGELRRFLTPQVADALMSVDADELTRPHRQRIAVFFCDLRGFTAFTKEAEPEEVVADLDQYYGTVGKVLQRHGATIGGYAGDGIMAYVGDPVPHEEPARAAVAMVAELRGPLDVLVREWQRRGHDLSYGIGLACGYATLGVVGFDGRFDYTPLGGVVNLAARLCGKAGPGQVLVDHATYAELDGVAVAEPVEGLELKGLGEKRAYALA